MEKVCGIPLNRNSLVRFLIYNRKILEVLTVRYDYAIMVDVIEKELELFEKFIMEKTQNEKKVKIELENPVEDICHTYGVVLDNKLIADFLTNYEKVMEKVVANFIREIEEIIEEKPKYFKSYEKFIRKT